jgi:PAS domain S-box-containing protein
VHVQLLALLAGAPGALITLLLLWMGDWTLKVQSTLTLLVLGVWWGAAVAVRSRVTRPLQAVSNLLLALREGDYSVRGHVGRSEDPLAEVLHEVNLLSETLRTQRLGALEADALLTHVIEGIDVAVLTFDEAGHLRLVNRASERLLARTRDEVLGKAARELELEELLEGPAPRRLTRTFAREGGPYELRRMTFRKEGRPHTLVVLPDLRLALREQEREAWRRLVRVLGHEINNSLAPIQSFAESLREMVVKGPRAPDWEEDMASGLEIIARRSESLGRFMSAYTHMARLPPPAPREMEMGGWVRRIAALEPRLPVEVRPGPELRLHADEDQLEQVLINLVRNAVEASLETRGRVWLSWRMVGPEELELCVEDEGQGLADTANLFVPFFTTKPGGSGIGLALSRQIAEAHGGSLKLENRTGERGCRARLRLPLDARS